ncbi:MAG: hypothetical protein IPL03_18725 [Sterolibacteriaceae bacterium]|nr:hypothetical protein [Candidatus Methylophosphatis haderslevensis]
MLSLVVDQYPIFGDAGDAGKGDLGLPTTGGRDVPVVFQQRLTDVVQMGRMQKTLANVQQLNVAVRRFLRIRCGPPMRNPAHMLDQARLDWFAELNRGLTDQLDRQVSTSASSPCWRLGSLAVKSIARATHLPALDGGRAAGVSNANRERKPAVVRYGFSVLVCDSVLRSLPFASAKPLTGGPARPEYDVIEYPHRPVRAAST